MNDLHLQMGVEDDGVNEISCFENSQNLINSEVTPRLIIQVAKLLHPKPHAKMETLPDMEDEDITPGINALFAGKDIERVTSPNKRKLEN